VAIIGNSIQEAKEWLEKNDVVGIPTETVYGLAGNALREEPILRIFEVKNRPKFDPLIAHTDSVDKIKGLIKQFPDQALMLAERFWPGPLTLLLDKKEIVPDILTSGHDRVAVRIPNHPLSLRLLSEIEFPLAAPSANPFGYVSPISANHVEDQLGDKIPYILDGGESRVGVESTIIGFEKDAPTIYRLGGLEIEEIEKVIGRVEMNINVSSDPSAPGMIKSHYSPGKQMKLGEIAQNLKNVDRNTTGVISFTDHFDVDDRNLFVLSPSGDLREAARNIFKALRKMDQPHIKTILAELVPEKGLGKAINDRLKRASA